MQSRPGIRIRYSGPRGSVPATGWLSKAVALAVTAVAVVVALIFSVVLLVALLAVGLIAGGYIWWRTRALRRQLREQMAAAQAQARAPAPQPRGDIIEGEFTRTSEAGDERQS